MTPDKLVEGFRHPGEPRRHPRRDVGYGPVAPLAALHRGTPPKRLRSRVGDEHYLRVSWSMFSCFPRGASTISLAP